MELEKHRHKLYASHVSSFRFGVMNFPSAFKAEIQSSIYTFIIGHVA